ncbi:hypothetical protein [Streptomyces zagrosensis]|uniref:Uncharacterized protein n=1 Tax=Streptomyces zagrosensis TaxID=1042984 RepID=A0A7W9UXB7_9ACTN|nr:hypothetical protein [Streptomyces zagrosensis]MBB5934728.1 hypothetical protein [Streptomyces zagrosensis]
MSPDRPQTAYAESAADLARRVLGALRGAGGTALVAEHVESAADPKTALAAIRVVGADTFAPYLLGDSTFHPQDAAALAMSFTVFPPPVSPPQPPPDGPVEPWVVAWRDWAMAALLGHFAAASAPGPAEVAEAAAAADPASLAEVAAAAEAAEAATVYAPQPQGAPLLADDRLRAAYAAGSAPAREEANGVPGASEGSYAADPLHAAGHTAAAAERPYATDGAATAEAAGLDWQRWSVRMGQLSPLALPGLEGPVHAAARGAPLALARGASRAMLRRDYPTAIHIVRWLALLSAEGVRLPLELPPLLEHLELLGGGGPRLALDLAIARHLLALEPFA